MFRSYCKNWVPLLDVNCTKMEEFEYSTPQQREASNDKADFTYYTGGGYELRLRGHIDTLNERIRTLQVNNWIDNRTRALIVEFSVYNAQVNKFGVVKIVGEFVGGGVLPYFRVDVLSLTRQKDLKGIANNAHLLQIYIIYVVLSGYLLYFCELAFILSTFYYIINNLAILKEEGAKEFFKTAWNVADVFTILLSLLSIAFYFLKTWTVLNLLKSISRDRGNKYVSIDQAKTINGQYELVVSITVFTSLLKLCKLLR